jgi:phage anti-repressor protein
MTTFNFELALNLVKSTEQFPVDFEDAWQWLEYSRKDVAKKAFDKCGFIENVDFTSFRQKVEREIGATFKEVIKLTNECFKVWAMMAGTPKGKEVRLYYLECEKIAKEREKIQYQLPTEISQLIQENHKVIQQSMQCISVLEDEKFHREFYLNQIEEITKEHPLFRSMLQLALIIKAEDYHFPDVSYTVRQILDMFSISTSTERRFSLLCSSLYWFNYNKKPNEKGVYTYTGKDLIYPSVILFKQENYDWKTIKFKFEMDYKIRFPSSNRKELKQLIEKNN